MTTLKKDIDRIELWTEINKMVDKVWAKHPRPHSSFHESYGILAEEVYEFFQEVCKKKPDRENTREELLQIIAVCVKTLESHKL